MPVPSGLRPRTPALPEPLPSPTTPYPPPEPVRGLSTKEISKTLFISEYTVQVHLSHDVFEKVGVRSRRELLKRLFFDNLYPTLFD